MYTFIVTKETMFGIAYKLTITLKDGVVVKSEYEQIVTIDIQKQKDLFASMGNLAEQNINFLNLL